MSRLALAKPAVRPSLKARLMLSGPAGAGKTLTGLEIASVLGERRLVIDTERESALTYADEYQFTHLPWREPYDPRELATELAGAAADHDVIMIDSFSHFWSGTGGTLDIADGKFGGWKTARPAQNDVVQAILSVPVHIIVCVRSQIEHVQEKDERTGKQVVKKLGLSPKQDKDLEYELNLSAEISIEHRLSVSKSRTTAVPVGRDFAPGHARDLANLYKDWLAGGEPFADLEVQSRIDTERRNLNDDQKRSLWDEWRRHALPNSMELLTVTQAELALELIGAAATAATDVPA